MPDSRQDRFIELLTRHQSQLLGYLFALVQNMADAEDLYQKTALVLWTKFDSFEEGTDFFSWSRQTAKYQVLNFLRIKRRSRVCFSESLVEELATKPSDQIERSAERQQALQRCLEQLSVSDRQLVELCYTKSPSIKAAADSLHRSADGVYKSLNRVRDALMNCVKRRLEKEGDR